MSPLGEVMICVMPSGNSTSSEAVDVRHRAREPSEGHPGNRRGSSRKISTESPG
jgi:hypothetical protein